MSRGVVQRWGVRAAVILVSTAALGYVSAAVSQRAAGVAAAALIETTLGTRDVFVLPDPPGVLASYPHSARALRLAGFTVRECPAAANADVCFPWAGLTVAVAGPFLLEVQWGADAGGLSGGGARAQYLALFGVVVPLREVGTWAS